jgi:hypothetical protein
MQLTREQRTTLNVLGPEGRQAVSQGMGVEVRSLIVRHLTDLAGSRHRTAQRLGASQTGYIANLAENFDQSSTLTVDETTATLAMRHPVLTRAVRDVTITGSPYLTIPLNALAYGRRVGEFSKFVLIKKGSGKGGSDKEKKPLDPSIPAWLLVRSVTQKRDRTLLPTVEEMEAAAAKGARNAIRESLAQAGTS